MRETSISCTGSASHRLRGVPERSGLHDSFATSSLQPVAIGAAAEVTKPSEPSRQTGRSGGAASRQAVTRVNAEQASKD